MATNSNERGSKASSGKRENAKTRDARKKRKFIVFGIELVVILVMVGILFVVMKKPNEEGPKFAEDFASKVVEDIPEPVKKEAEEETGTMYGYMNVALFGVDAVNDKELTSGSRSDCIMIASINLDTGEVRLVSVYRDTFLNLGNDRYAKCNGAYSLNGAEQAVKMLNTNLDMNIENFVTVGYKGLSQVIDGLGGVEIDVDEKELQWINDFQLYMIENTEMMKGYTYTPITRTGKQTVNGLQASAYCRIRKIDDDFHRTGRQREVLTSILEQAKKADLVTLTNVLNTALPNIYTSFSKDDILTYLPQVGKFSIMAQDGFPQEDMRTVENIDERGSCVIPLDLESNVVWLHKFFFDDENYSVTANVKEYTEVIKKETSKYITQ